MLVADSLSRSYLDDLVYDDAELSYVIEQKSKRLEFQEAIRKDKMLSNIQKFVTDGNWQQLSQLKDPDYKQYCKLKN